MHVVDGGAGGWVDGRVNRPLSRARARAHTHTQSEGQTVRERQKDTHTCARARTHTHLARAVVAAVHRVSRLAANPAEAVDVLVCAWQLVSGAISAPNNRCAI